jgi:hypothetical protein
MIDFMDEHLMKILCNGAFKPGEIDHVRFLSTFNIKIVL